MRRRLSGPANPLWLKSFGTTTSSGWYPLKVEPEVGPAETFREPSRTDEHVVHEAGRPQTRARPSHHCGRHRDRVRRVRRGLWATGGTCPHDHGDLLRGRASLWQLRKHDRHSACGPISEWNRVGVDGVEDVGVAQPVPAPWRRDGTRSRRRGNLRAEALRLRARTMTPCACGPDGRTR